MAKQMEQSQLIIANFTTAIALFLLFTRLGMINLLDNGLLWLASFLFLVCFWWAVTHYPVQILHHRHILDTILDFSLFLIIFLQIYLIGFPASGIIRLWLATFVIIFVIILVKYLFSYPHSKSPQVNLIKAKYMVIALVITLAMLLFSTDKIYQLDTTILILIMLVIHLIYIFDTTFRTGLYHLKK